MPERVWRQLLTLMLSLVTQSHPDLASAQVLIQRLRTITLTVQRRQLLAHLQPCLELPINGRTIGNTSKNPSRWITNHLAQIKKALES